MFRERRVHSINDVKELSLSVDIDCIDNNKGKYSTNGSPFICCMLLGVARSSAYGARVVT